MSNTNKRYNEEFKKQIVELINSGKNIKNLLKSITLLGLL
jgi:transposase